MNDRYYRVKQDNFIWTKGAILKQDKALGSEKTHYGYTTINDVHFASEHVNSEYITGTIIENSPDWFERVYPINLISKTVYKLKDEAKEFMAKDYAG